MAGQRWPDCDEDIKAFTTKLVEELEGLLRDRLTGIYLHGSLAMGSYYRPKSDIDLIVVIDTVLDAAMAEAVGVAVAARAGERPTVGSIELSVITAGAARRVPVPTPYEVHYSSEWHDRIMRREVDYTNPRTDPDLPSHLMYVVQRGIRLAGKQIPEVFGPVEWRHFMASVLADCQWILEGDHILETPFYGVLNICRVLQLLSENRQKVYSKDEGGEWGLAHLPSPYRPLIRQALAVYRSSDVVTEESRKIGGAVWDQDQLLDFRNYARAQLHGNRYAFEP